MPLEDDLVPMIDGLRGELNSAFGTRQYDVYIVRRRWPSGRIGDDAEDTQPPVVTAIKLDPRPSLVFPTTGARFWAMTAAGRDLSGEAVLMEVSLTYTEDQLTGGAFDTNPSDDEDFYYMTVDALTQGVRPRYWKPNAPPIPDREKTIGWVVPLKVIAEPTRAWVAP